MRLKVEEKENKKGIEKRQAGIKNDLTFYDFPAEFPL